jgi:dynein heavy chain, axonemal
MHYVQNPESIHTEELTKFNKKWLRRALDHVPDYLLENYPIECKMLFHDILQNYITSMKMAIMDYILKSPDERKRLHIMTLPHVVLTSAER